MLRLLEEYLHRQLVVESLSALLLHTLSLLYLPQLQLKHNQRTKDRPRVLCGIKLIHSLFNNDAVDDTELRKRSTPQCCSYLNSHGPRWWGNAKLDSFEEHLKFCLSPPVCLFLPLRFPNQRSQKYSHSSSSHNYVEKGGTLPISVL